MTKQNLEILSNKIIAKNTFLMILKGDTTGIKTGQFINLSIDGFYLKRPISVCDVENDKITIIYKVVGEGTKALSQMKVSQKIEALTGLGNGYNTAIDEENILLVGGGCGVPPLYMLAKELIKQGKKITCVFGFNSADEIYFKEEFEQIGCKVIICTVDGSKGVKGFVSEVLGEVNAEYHFVCGPVGMLKAVYENTTTSGQYSFEERMGCGFGACMGCSCKTKYGNKRICKEGPVLVKEEIIW